MGFLVAAPLVEALGGGVLGNALASALVGGALGAAGSAATGGKVGKGALKGALGGAAGGALGQLFSGAAGATSTAAGATGGMPDAIAEATKAAPSGFSDIIRGGATNALGTTLTSAAMPREEITIPGEPLPPLELPDLQLEALMRKHMDLQPLSIS